jgi:putative flippase GtrA
MRFAAVGFACTALYLLLFGSLRPALSSQLANVVALALTAVVNTAVNRRVAFRVRGRDAVLRHYGQGIVVFLAGLSITAAALQILRLVDVDHTPLAEIVVLTIGSAVATVVRFLLLRMWVFKPRAAPGPAAVAAPPTPIFD